jgi:hypothetical protein
MPNNKESPGNMAITHKTELSQTIDWLQVTSPSPVFPASWRDDGKLNLRGQWGYTRSVTYSDGRVTLFSPERLEMRTHTVYSGSTLATLYERYGTTPFEILTSLARSAVVTRIDIAVDAMRGFLDFDAIVLALQSDEAITKAERVDRFQGIDSRADTVYLGSPSSARRLRIYDKASEQKITEFEWTRIELQSRKPFADETKNALLAGNFSESIIPGIITGFCDFPTLPDWQKIFCGAPILLTAPPKGRDGTLHWLLKSAAPCLARMQAENPDRKILEQFLAQYREKFAEYS